jgi:hypothetical protein
MIEDQIKGAGTNMITVNAGNFSRRRPRRLGHSSTLTPTTPTRSERSAGVQYLAAGISMQAQVVAANQNWFTRIQGTGRRFADSRLANPHRQFLQHAGRHRRREGRGARQIGSRDVVRVDADPVGQVIRSAI